MKNGLTLLIFKRIVTSIVTIFLLVTFVFFLVRSAPGDPSLKYLSKSLDNKLQESLRESFQLDKPVHLQYLGFLSSVIKGDFGISYDYRRPVLSVIVDYLPFTLTFSSISFVLQLLLSMYFALIAVKNINGIFDKIFSKLMVIAYATPTFVIGVLLIYIFSVKLNLFPSSGSGSLDAEELTGLEKLFDSIKHLLLPFITLSIVEISIFYKYMRDNLTEVFNKTFVLNLRASGMAESTIIYKHIVPNAINPLISAAGVELGILLGGTLIIEVIFGLPGMGRLTVNAIMARDYPLVIGCTIVAGFLVILANLMADILRVKLDKRFLAGSLN